MVGIVDAWSSPRYLGHSVRETVTYTLTYFPLLLWFLTRRERPLSAKSPGCGRMTGFALVALAAFMMLFTYQVLVSLHAGVGNLAQKPDFAIGGQLSIPYLLASHYFEHFLDTVFFTLTGLLFYSLSQPNTGGASERACR
jgi:hypothetical protein